MTMPKDDQSILQLKAHPESRVGVIQNTRKNGYVAILGTMINTDTDDSQNTSIEFLALWVTENQLKALKKTIDFTLENLQNSQEHQN